MQLYTPSLLHYQRLKTREVTVGNLKIGNGNPIRVQTMTTKDTMDTLGTVEEVISCVKAGAELVRITAPSKKEAENLLNIKNELRKRGYDVPLVADIHFTPNAAEIAAGIVEKVRINPGNYIDKKKFELITYIDEAYQEELDRIRKRFVPLINICKEHGTAMRIGTNHGSLSDRILSRYGDTPNGMVESALEFLRIARDENYHQIVLSMKSSNPQVMVQAYRLLVQAMNEEFGECYPLHLGVTEAGDGEDGRIKSAVGIGTLLEEGIGDTIRVSLTEDAELEIPVCRDLVKRYPLQTIVAEDTVLESVQLPYSPFSYQRRTTNIVQNIGGKHVPIIIADFSTKTIIQPEDLQSIGYTYNADTDKWSIGDQAADYIYLKDNTIDFDLPGTLIALLDFEFWQTLDDSHKYIPVCKEQNFESISASQIYFLQLNTGSANIDSVLEKTKAQTNVIYWFYSDQPLSMQLMRQKICQLISANNQTPIIIGINSHWQSPDEHLIHFSIEAGGLLLDGFGDGIALTTNQTEAAISTQNSSGRNYSQNLSLAQFLNTTAFGILQATRTRISKTEYISCPSCGRTLFDLQETTEKIRSVTHHLKGVKIAVMGCIVNGPGEMADADFGYVGSGVGKVTLYKGQEVMKRNVDSSVAVDELINLLKESGVWKEMTVLM